jgi:hypothetical protein
MVEMREPGKVLAAYSAVTRVDLNLRVGPGTNYGVVDVIPAGYPVTVIGCLPDYAWCDVDFEGLAAMAEKVYPAGIGTQNDIYPRDSGGDCDMSVRGNWGDPENPNGPCHYYFPIIYAQGDLHIAGGARGQGILLVEGDLDLTGGSEFHGAVIVKGNFKTGGQGNKVMGSLSTWGVDNEINASVGRSEVHLSTCALERASRYNNRASRAFPLDERSWIDLSGLGGSI